MAIWNKYEEANHGYRNLHEAASAGNLETVKRMIRNGTKVDETNEHGAPSLLYAAARGHLDVAQYLVDSGADVDFLIKEGGTPLMGAVRCLKPKLVAFLLSKGAQPNKRGDGGLFPLACPFQPGVAAVDKQVKCIRLLVSAGARINDRTDTGFTPLMKAAWFGNTQAAEELLSLGADLGLQDNHGKTAAMIAFERGHDELAKLLKDTGPVT